MRKTNILLAACGLLLSSCLLCACGSNEPVKPDNPDNPDTPDTPDIPDTPDTPQNTPQKTPDKPDTPKTGDESRPLLWASLMALALFGLIGSLVVMKKNKKNR